MKALKLVAREGDGGDMGLALSSVDSTLDFSVDHDGTLTAHDILEHQNGINTIGPVWDELEAMGGVWQVRGRWGDMLNGHRSMHPPEVHIASDIARMYAEGEWDEVPPFAHRLPNTRPCDDEDALDDIIREAHSIIASESKFFDNPTEGVDRYLDIARGRFRVGYRKAARRFGHTPYATGQFAAIRDAVANAIRRVDFEGQEFTLLYGKGKARVTERVYDDFYY